MPCLAKHEKLKQLFSSFQLHNTVTEKIQRISLEHKIKVLTKIKLPREQKETQFQTSISEKTPAS